jgi:uncharacterized protein
LRISSFLPAQEVSRFRKECGQYLSTGTWPKQSSANGDIVCAMKAHEVVGLVVRGTVGVAFVCSLAACPNDNIVRPEDPTYSDAVGGQSTPVIEAHGEPLVVDWRPESRGDLEIAMKEGVAVVAYSPEGMKLLKDCHTSGEYGFIGMSLKEQVISLEDENEIRANLPLSGIGIAGKIGGELKQGAVLNVALAMVGKRKTTWKSVVRGELTGPCDGATHFVRGATIGAFVMKTGTRGEATTAAEVFGLGASAKTGSQKNVMNKDGSLSACRTAKPDAADPPSQCTALIRLELNRIGEGSNAKAPPAPATEAAPNPCPSGMVMSAGKCAAPNAQRPHRCRPGDIADCTAQCDRGQPESCVNLGFASERGQGAAPDVNRAAQLYQKACELGSALGCHNLGYLLSEGPGIAHDAAKAASLFERACTEGEARGCNSLGAAFFAGAGVAANPSTAAGLFKRACNGGEPGGCTNLGSLRLTGMLGNKDAVQAARLFERACDGRDPAGCASLASAFETGNGVAQDLARAVALYDRSCQSGYALGCYGMAVLATLGKGVPKDPARAQSLFQQACTAREVMSCATLRVAYAQQVAIDAQEANLYRATYEKTCAAGEASDCTNLGILMSATGDPGGKAMMAKGCSMGDAWGCHLAK